MRALNRLDIDVSRLQRGGLIGIGSQTTGSQLTITVTLFENQALVVEAFLSGSRHVSLYWIRCFPHDFRGFR